MAYGTYGIGRGISGPSEIEYSIPLQMARARNHCFSAIFARLVKASNFPLSLLGLSPKDPLVRDQAMAEATIAAFGTRKIVDFRIPLEVTSSLSSHRINVDLRIPYEGGNIHTLQIPLLCVEGPGLRLIVCSFGGNKEIAEGGKPWQPLISLDLGLPLFTLEALKKANIRGDGAMFTSLASAGFEIFNKLSPSQWPELPHLLVFNKSFTSTKELFDRPITCCTCCGSSCECNGCGCINGFSKCADWDADAIKGIKNYATHHPRKFVFDTVEADVFFPGGSVNSPLYEELERTGSSVIAIHGWVPYVHPRAHHIYPLHLIAAAPTPVSEMKRYGEDLATPRDDMSVTSYTVSQLPPQSQSREPVTMVFFGGAKDTREVTLCRDALYWASLWFKRYGHLLSEAESKE